MGRKNKEEEKEENESGIGVAVKCNQVNDPSGHLHMRVQTCFHYLPFPLALRTSSSARPTEFLRVHPWREGALQPS